MPNSRVFWTMPEIRSFYLDLERTREKWIAEGNPETSDFLPKRDSAGRWVDFHSLRKTFATALVRANVTPQTSREIMRHADVRTTMTHYVDLSLRDLSAAVSGVPDVEGVDSSILRAMIWWYRASPEKREASRNQLEHLQLRGDYGVGKQSSPLRGAENRTKE